MNKWKYFLRSYFGFSKKETNGFIILIVLLFLTLLTTIGITILYPEPQLTTEEDKKVLAQLLSNTSNSVDSTPGIRKHESSFQNHFFDPNTIEEQGLERIVGKRIAGTIIKYRAKGGFFYKKEDMRKIYGISNELYEKISPWIKINAIEKGRIKHAKERVALSFDINKADTVQLQKLKGIGKVLAGRIIKFRDKLGGFYSKEQYVEIYGLSPEALTELKNKAYVGEQFQPSKISLNNSADDILFSHPYIGRKLAYPILKHRKGKGFTTIEELKTIKEMPEDVYFKLLPYIIL